jgi:hypothetical protein
MCRFDKDCEGKEKKTSRGVIYCPECGEEDYSEMEDDD